VQGDRVSAQGLVEIWARPLADGTKAVGIFNRDDQERKAVLDFGSLGFTGSAKVRDLWEHKDLGVMKTSYTMNIPAHSVVLLKVGR